MSGLSILAQVGAQVVADGARVEPRLDRQAAVVVSELQARYSEAMARGQLFFAANPAAQAVSVALATTYTGLCLFNPVGSGKIIVPLKWKFALSVAPAAIATMGLISGHSATGGVTAETQTITPRSTQIGNGSSASAHVLSQATIVTPVWSVQTQDGFTAAALPAPTLLTDLEGTFGLLPGGFMAVGALTAVTGLGSVVWMELPYTA